MSYDNLRAHLLEDDIFMQSIIDTIPPMFYFEDDDVIEKIRSEKHVSVDEKLKSFNNKHKKISSVKTKHKLCRLDPNCHKTVSEIQNELLDEEEKKIRAKKKNKKLGTSLASRVGDIEALQNRLQSKIAELELKRKSNNSEGRTDKKQIKRQLSKLKRKHLKVKVIGTNQVEIKNCKNVSEKPVFNKEGKIVFSKFDFSESSSGKKDHSERNNKKILRKVVKEKEKLEDIEKNNPEKSREIKKKKMWKRTMSKAEGIKVKDDPLLLKKSIKKEEDKKQKSKKKWQARKEHVNTLKKKRQDKRKENIKARKDEKIKNKIKKAKKKGRIVV